VVWRYIVLGLLSMGGCTSTEPSAEWITAWERVNAVATRSAAFGFTYFGADESDVGVKVVALDSAVEDPCLAIESRIRGENPAQNFWALDVATTKRAPGSYPIAPSLNAASDTPQSAVLLKHVKGREEIERRTALTGVVDLLPPEGSPGVLRLKVTALFPVRSLRSLMCEGGGSRQAETSISCLCTDGQVESRCSGNGAGDCCHDLESPRVESRIDLVATQCSKLCTATSPALLGRCMSDQ
jgi:hypothetical protein